jgi:hypothetical protein
MPTPQTAKARIQRVRAAAVNVRRGPRNCDGDREERAQTNRTGWWSKSRGVYRRLMRRTATAVARGGNKTSVQFSVDGQRLPGPRPHPTHSRLDRGGMAAQDGPPGSEGDRSVDARLRPGDVSSPGSPGWDPQAGHMSPTRVAANGAEGAVFVCLMLSDLCRDDDAVRLPKQRRGVSPPGRGRRQRDLSNATPGCGAGSDRSSPRRYRWQVGR